MKTKISTHVLSFFKRGVAHFEDMRWERYKTALLKDVTDSRQRAYTTILDNQRNGIRAEPGALPTTFSEWLGYVVGNEQRKTRCTTNEFTFELIKQTLDKLACWDMVGVQPTSGPTGLMYSLQYKPTEDESAQLSLVVLSKAVEATSRSLRTRMKLEATNGATMYQGNFEETLLSVLSTEIAFEINVELLADLVHIAKDTHTDVPCVGVDATSVIGQLHRAANEIARSAQRGAGNWAVIDMPTFSVLQNSTASNQELVELVDDAQIVPSHVTYVGETRSGIALYVAPFFSSMSVSVLVGYKGQSEMDAGYMYCPYLALIDTGVAIDPNTFEPVKGFMTRYGKTVTGQDGSVGKEYYRTISFTEPE